MSQLPIESILFLIGATYNGINGTIFGFYKFYDPMKEQTVTKVFSESFQNVLINLMFFLLGLRKMSSSLLEHEPIQL